ncbi:MAG: phytanoyl-CoA dioxygenase family protein [Paenibacillus sp.]|jgi:phytanoyl-CoA hydroxylase|nr:phytanoyl-CoA dioxygenase family protein [Paenibacillus sp.]
MKLTNPEEINQMLYPAAELVQYVEHLNDLQASDADFYREQGYLAARTGLSEQTVENAKQAIREMLEARRVRSREDFEALMLTKRVVPLTEAEESKKVQLPSVQITRSEEQVSLSSEQYELATRKIGDFVNYDQRFYDIAHDPAILKAVELALGEPGKLVQDMALLKPPQGGGEKPWHQDMAYRGLDFEKAIVGVWIALDEAGVDNGCMHIIPRSHMRGGVPHYAVRDWQICDENVEVDRAYVAPLQPGGMLFFHGLLHHGTPSNFSSKKRRALQFHYAPASAEWVTPKEYKRMFTNEMSGAKC